MNEFEMIKIIYLIFLCKYKNVVDYNNKGITIFLKDGTKVNITIKKEKE